MTQIPKPLMPRHQHGQGAASVEARIVLAQRKRILERPEQAPRHGKILQITHNYTSLFLIAGSVYLLAIIVLRTLAPNLRRVNLQS